MGQYRQWLHYRDIDRHLHTQREQLMQKIAHLQEQLQRLETTHPNANNSIVQALIMHYATQDVQPQAMPTSPTPLPFNSQADSVREETAQYTPHPQTPVPSVSPMYASLPPLPLPSLPQNRDEDVSDISAPTDPQITIPQWLLRATSTSQSGPLDPQGLQTNRLVQRWLERWGKQLPDQPDQSVQNQEQHNGTSLNQHQSNAVNPATHEDSYL